jgi:hypothetical protein
MVFTTSSKPCRKRLWNANWKIRDWGLGTGKMNNPITDYQLPI